MSHRPTLHTHLLQFIYHSVSDFDMEGDFLDDVMASFWKLYAMRPVNYVIAAIEARGKYVIDS